MKILTVGDSYTDHHEKRSLNLPIFKIWPEILVDRFDGILYNKAICGIGNYYIFNTLLDTLSTFNNFDLAIVMWSDIKRIDDEFGFEDKLHHRTKYNSYSYKSFQFISRTKLTSRLFYMTNILSEKFNIPIIQCSGCGDIHYSIIDSPYFDLIDTKYILGWPFSRKLNGMIMSDILKEDEIFGDVSDINTTWKVDGELVKYDRHPNEKGHQKMAQVIGDYIVEKNLVVDST